jgi:hypothetical protein
MAITINGIGIPKLFAVFTTSNKGAVPDNAGMCYWIGDEEESIKQGEAG